MGYDMRFPDDLYYWGQNRLGSFIPWLSNLLQKITYMEPIEAISVAQYSIVLITCLIFSRYINVLFLKFVFVLFCFFPIPIFPEFLYIAHPYTAQFFFISVSVYLTERYFRNTDLNLFYFFFSLLAIGLALWASELSALFLAVYVFLLGFYLILEKNDLWFKIKNITIHLLVLLIALSIVVLFIYYAKLHAVGQEYANVFAGFTEFKAGILKHFSTLLSVLTNPFDNAFLTTYVFFFFLLCLFFIFCFFKYDFKNTLNYDFKKIIRQLFLLNALLSALALYLTDWASRNNYEYRYWTYSFISFGVFLFMYADVIYNSRKKIILTLVSLLAITQTVLSIQHGLNRNFAPWNEYPYSELKEDVKKLKHCGIIGNYWFTYLLSSVKPVDCIAVPKEGEFIRNAKQLPDLFEKEKLFLVKNNWFETFPDSITQYGVLLKKSGEPFFIDKDIELCRYNKISYKNTFYVKNMHYRNAVMINDSAALKINVDELDFNDFVVYGPYSLLNKGKYRARFFVETDTLSLSSDVSEITFDVSTDWGREVHASKTVSKKDLAPQVNFDLFFELNQFYTAFEARIFLKGNASLVFRKLEIEQIE